MSVLLSFSDKSPRKLGSEAERTAVGYLQRRRWRILDTNYHTRQGEIDIIARDGDQLVFVEVKSSQKQTEWYAGNRIDLRKQKRMLLTARHYIASHEIPVGGIRFDAVIMVAKPNGEWSIEHIKDAFRIEEDG